MKRLSILIFIALCAWSCAEAERFSISSNDTTPPGDPIFIASKPLDGGARIFFLAPDDNDLLSVAVTWKNSVGEDVVCTASYFTDSLDVYGFPSAGEHLVELYAIDRAGNTSGRVGATVISNEPPLVTVAKSVELIPSFGSLMIHWEDVSRTPIYVYADVSFGGRDFSRAFASSQTETCRIDSLRVDSSVPVEVRVTIKDKYKNSFEALNETVHLLTDSQIQKEGWTLLSPGESKGGAVMADGDRNGGFTNKVIDGKTESDGSFNYFSTDQANPWNIIIDLGEEYELSRIVTHQRYSGVQYDDLRGNYYRGSNVMAYNLYFWNEAGNEWVFASRHDITVPVVKQAADYKTLGDRGDEAYFYPEQPGFTLPTRYLRYEAVSGKDLSEITLYGRKAQN